MRSDGRMRKPTALTFSSAHTNWSTGMEPLSRGFRTLQSGMSSLARQLLATSGLGGPGRRLGRRKTGSRQAITWEPQVGAGYPQDLFSWGGARAWPGAAGPCVQGLRLQLALHTVHTS